MPFEAQKQAEVLPSMVLDARLALAHPATRAAREYWETRCKDRTMPARGDLDHAGMRGFIAHVGLVACSGGDEISTYRIRLAGTEWEAVFGPMTSRCLSEFLSPEIERRWHEVFDAVCDRKAPLRVSTRLGHKGKTWLDAEIFVAPLSEDGDQVTMLFLCFAVTNTVRPQSALLIGQ